MFQNSDGKPLIGRIKLRWKTKHLRFSTIVDGYLGKGTRYTDSYYGCINRKCVTLEWWPWMTLSDPEKWVTRGPILDRSPYVRSWVPLNRQPPTSAGETMSGEACVCGSISHASISMVRNPSAPKIFLRPLLTYLCSYLCSNSLTQTTAVCLR